jgi:alkanesulfonate monooxygenase SsuD/methylene tetrahydromethanopterin reductase-like flavin-dependent oxidoreductase (luciferase family)
MTDLRVGITLPTLGELKHFGLGTGSITSGMEAAARHVESVGLDAVWVPDLIIGDGTPALECTVTAATAAAVTERVHIGFGVLVLPLRPVAWTAAQIATLQHLSGNRVLLGVGAGGFPRAPFWQAVGVPGREGGSRTDAALDVLARLIAGQPTRLGHGGDGPSVTLAPAAQVPPILVGGNSDMAIRRAATRGLGWLPSLLTSAALHPGVTRLRELAAQHGWPQPGVTVGGHAMVGDRGAVRSTHDTFVRGLIDAHRIPPDEAARIPLYGSLGGVAERLAGYAEAGADGVALALDGEDWMRQCELVAEARASLS